MCWPSFDARVKLTRVKPPGDPGDDPGQFESFGGDPVVFSPGGFFEPDIDDPVVFLGHPVVLKSDPGQSARF